MDFRGPSPRSQWGRWQTGVVMGERSLRSERLFGSEGNYWVYALPNPHPEKALRALRLAATGTDTLAIAGITLYSGEEHPLQRHRLETLRVTLPDDVLPEGLPVTVDLGIIARKYAVPAFVPDQWLWAAVQGWGQEATPAEPAKEVLLDVTASAETTPRVSVAALSLRDVYESGKATDGEQRVSVELLTPQRAWVHVSVEDAATGRPTPVRIHFRAPNGRYIPPYGHRHEVNDNWFEDYGGDCKLGSTEYAYIDGRCQEELPVGEVYVEICKGFEYQPIRRRLQVEPGQSEIRIPIERPVNWRQRGWVTADTHVHFISPQTAWLEAQAEGINLVSLLATQLGGLFSNVADLTGGLSGCSHDDTLVWVGTENRQHMLGHISLLAGKGRPVYPMCAGGPSESYLGDPVWVTLAQWADACREREGVVVMPHFGTPYSEVVADVILGKVDAVELRDFRLPSLDSFPVLEWYRYLNCGYRVAAVGGTDKMSAGMPLGGVRTYAFLDEEFNFANWAKAVRAGRTFSTTGPLLNLQVEGHAPGDEIHLPEGGGTLAVEARVESVQPFSELQVVANGKVVASAKPGPDGRSCVLRTELLLPGSGWVAARCLGQGKVWHEWPVHLAAHTSPVYVVAGGQEVFSPSDATYMLTVLEGGLTWLDTLSIRADPERHRRNRRVFEDARAILHRRLHAAEMAD